MCDVICSAKDVIYMPSVASSTQRVVMSYLGDTMPQIQWMWCYRYIGCEVIHIVAVISSIRRV